MKQSRTMQISSFSSSKHRGVSAMSDKELYAECRKVGEQIRLRSGKFEPLLLEVFERGLYKKYFSTIHEFAYKIAGFNKEKVDKILRLSKKLEDKPIMKAAFESGELTYSKLEDVVFVATSKNESLWTEKAKSMPRLQLKLEVQQARTEKEKVTAGGNSESVESVISFKIDTETERNLRALQNTLEKERGEQLTFGEVMKILINQEHEALIEKAQRKKTANYCPDCVKKRADEAAAKSEITRAVPAEVRHMVLARQNYRCTGGQTCTHPPAELHHLDGWAITKKHDADRMRYLCRKHHAEIHADDARVQAYRSG